MIYLLFFLSGVAGLVYENIWARQFGTLLGNTAYSAAAVLAAYFTGLAMGYVIGGRLAARLRSALAGYGIAEIIAAGCALVVTPLLALTATPELARLLSHSAPGVQLALRAGYAWLILLPATLALGATLPLIAQAVSFAGGRRTVALAYGANTLGAALGVLLSMFALIPYLGIHGGTWCAAGLSLACGLGALWLARQQTRAGSQGAQADAGAAQARPEAFWLILAALSGGGLLALEVAYTRMFALILNNSTYTFGAVLAVTLAALALASYIAPRLARRWPPELLAPWAAITGGAVSLVAAVAFQQFTGLKYLTSGGGFAGYVITVLALALAIIGPPLAILGLILPLGFIAGRAGGGAGFRTGMLTALNALAGALGALLGGLVLIPAIGLWPSLLALGLVFTVAGLCLLAMSLPLQRIGLAAVAALALCGISGWRVLDPPWPLGRAVAEVYARDTAYGLIQVVRDGRGDLWLRQDYHYSLGATFGSDSELRQGCLPLLLHPKPQRVAFLGLATGITAAGGLDHPEVERLEVAELIPEVITGAEYFSKQNRNILDNPRAHVEANDARHFLYAADARYDVIVSDLFTPWHSQTGYLYTVEHYRAARAHLADGGVFAQWLPLYQLSPKGFELIADSFASVFPCVTVWRGEMASTSPLLMLVGSEAPLELDAAALQTRLAALPPGWVGPYGFLRQPPGLVEFYIGDWPAPAPGIVLNTDAHPRLEFTAPVSQSREEFLTGARLRQYYNNVLLKLPQQNLRYLPRQGEPMPDLGAGRRTQAAGVRDN